MALKVMLLDQKSFTCSFLLAPLPVVGFCAVGRCSWMKYRRRRATPFQNVHDHEQFWLRGLAVLIDTSYSTQNINATLAGVCYPDLDV